MLPGRTLFWGLQHVPYCVHMSFNTFQEESSAAAWKDEDWGSRAFPTGISLNGLYNVPFYLSSPR